MRFDQLFYRPDADEHIATAAQEVVRRGFGGLIIGGALVRNDPGDTAEDIVSAYHKHEAALAAENGGPTV